ncbi:uncharacterized protein LOC111697317 [Eurytemora carolleeae]|uniref:uncharacterized protein LOC111697317 n=1 Tax=Eurytemora carolleeae TaxID=1294199 RepID=UPI000C77984B|nr:uncharacterized protein LOC111697317 [Eurytemora carolleeae]|eukprot:XP_023323039.1 uncharacterized protein LOC111697317 [Eurytemora affinis]
MEVRSRIRLSQAVIHLFMLISGIEYAIVFPTLWEYLQSVGVHHSQTYWLGLAISAMTATDIICGLIAGWLVDFTSKTRPLLLLLNGFQVAGSILYIFSTSHYLILVSRLVSGCGKSIAVVFLADICKSTSREERTPVLLLFNIASHIGMLLGPSLNLIVRWINVETPYLTLNKLNAPGLIMLCLWSLFTFLVLLVYVELVELKCEEMLTNQLDLGYTNETLQDILESGEAEDEDPEYLVENDTTTTSEGSDLQEIEIVLTSFKDCEFKEKVDEIRYGSQYIQGASPCSRTHPASGSSPSTRTRYTSSILPPNLPNRRISGFLTRDLLGHRNSITSYGSLDSNGSRWEYNRNPLHLLRRDTRKSDKFINEAERLMGESMYSTTNTTIESLYPSRDGSLSYTGSIALTWSDYRNALLKPEIVILTFIRCIAMFCQTNLESIVPPIMNTYFGFDDKANSYFFLAAGGQLVVMFCVLSCLTRLVSDRNLVLVGLVALNLALAWNTATIPHFAEGDAGYLKYFGVGVFLELVGVPAVSDIGLALYSKLLPERVQGFAHGARRFLSLLAMMLGPVWGGALLPHPLVLTILPLLLQIIGTVLFIFSFKQMKPEEINQEEDVNENTPLLVE